MRRCTASPSGPSKRYGALMPSIISGCSTHHWHWPFTLGWTQMSQKGGSNGRMPSIHLAHNASPSLPHPTQGRGSNRSSAERARLRMPVRSGGAIVGDIFPATNKCYSATAVEVSAADLSLEGRGLTEERRSHNIWRPSSSGRRPARTAGRRYLFQSRSSARSFHRAKTCRSLGNASSGSRSRSKNPTSSASGPAFSVPPVSLPA